MPLRLSSAGRLVPLPTEKVPLAASGGNLGGTTESMLRPFWDEAFFISIRYQKRDYRDDNSQYFWFYLLISYYYEEVYYGS